jgi:hypothetical protein
MASKKKAPDKAKAAPKKQVAPSPTPPPRPRDLPPPRALSLNLAPLAPDVVAPLTLQVPTVDFGTYLNLDALSQEEFDRLQATVTLLQQAIVTVAKAAEPGTVPKPPPTPPPSAKG